MKRITSLVLFGGIVGLIAGYLFFGQVAGEYVSAQALFSFGSGSGFGGVLRQAARQIAGIDEIRRNILLTGAVGAIVAASIGVFAPGRRRR